jgi:hypothetical protein
MTTQINTATETKRPWWRRVFDFAEAMEDRDVYPSWEHFDFLRKRTEDLEMQLQKLETAQGKSNGAD